MLLRGASSLLCLIFYTTPFVVLATDGYTTETAGDLERRDTSKYEEDMHYFTLFHEEGELTMGLQPSLITVQNVWSEIEQVYRGSLSVQLSLSTDAITAAEHCPQSWELHRVCLVHTKPVVKDRTCILHPKFRADPEEPLHTQFIGPHDSHAALRAFFIKQLGFAIGLIEGINITMKDRFTVRGDHQKCPHVSAKDLTDAIFLQEYFLPQRPVVITDAFGAPSLVHVLEILQRHKDTIVGAKLSPDDSFEGIEDVSRWERYESQYIPDYVLQQLESPDKVVVRNAHMELTIAEVLHLISKRLKAERYNTTAANVYVEYLDMLHSDGLSSLYRHIMNSTDHLPEWAQYFYEVFSESQHKDNKQSTFLNADLGMDGLYHRTSRNRAVEPEPVKPMLWLGDGRTVGKLHFDPYDNILFQLQGEKKFRLLDPEENERLYEGHMREAILEVFPEAEHRHDFELHSNIRNVNQTPLHTFRRRRLLESTSMVHSPVDINNAKAEHWRYPMATDLAHMDCVVKPGEVLYVPSYWWHEVTSRPSPHVVSGIRLNMAVNFWFSPLFVKSFPCARCRKQINTLLYEKVLRMAAERGLL